MADEKNNDKHRVNPGLVRSASNYSQLKHTAVSNPTMQLAVVALPTAEKDSTFKEKYADSLKLSWVPASYEEMINIQSAAAAEAKFEVKSTNKFVEKVEKPKVKSKAEKIEVAPEMPADNIPSDIEMLLSQAASLKEVKEDKVLAEQPVFITDIPVEEPNKAEEEVNVFEAINTLPVVEESKEEVKSDSFADKPFMKIDKVEIRKTTGADGEVVYMVGKQINSAEEFAKYLQSVYGKLLASDCKKIEYEDKVFTRQSGGMYKDLEGNLVTADDIISLISGGI